TAASTRQRERGDADLGGLQGAPGPGVDGLEMAQVDRHDRDGEARADVDRVRQHGRRQHLAGIVADEDPERTHARQGAWMSWACRANQAARSALVFSSAASSALSLSLRRPTLGAASGPLAPSRAMSARTAAIFCSCLAIFSCN